MELLIIGCGVSGLSTGVRLLEAGHHVRIWAKALPPDTTSNAAAALWYPYRAYPEEKVSAWGAVAYREFQRLAAEAPESGVLMASVLDLKAASVGDPWWVGGVEGFRHATPDELPSGYADAYVLDAPVMDTSAYLTWLRGRFEALGGTVEQHEIHDFAEAFAECPIIINCVGLGARELAGDRDIHPARGQVVRVRHTGFRRVLLDDEGPNALAYIVPRVHDIVLGGIDEDHNESTAIEPAVRVGILERCARLVAHYDPIFAASLRALSASLLLGKRPGEGAFNSPSSVPSFPLPSERKRGRGLGGLGEGAPPAEIVSEGAGLRPVRSAIRLERERVAPDRWLLHNYGHGGAGVTLSWGCADEVARLVKGIVPPTAFA